MSAREHHRRFKYALVTRALTDPAGFLRTCTSDGGVEALWAELGADLAEDDGARERLPSAGLGVRVLGGEDAPVVMVTLPPPEQSNEAQFIVLVPAAARVADHAANAEGDEEHALVAPVSSDEPPCFRAFAMERSMLPGGGYIAFVVEWTGARRRNYDAPRAPSQNAFWEAVVDIFAGKRAAIHSVAMPLGDARAPRSRASLAMLERSTWFSAVGRGLTPGWPERYDDVRIVTSWEEARALAQAEGRSIAGEHDDAQLEDLAPRVQEMLARKIPKGLHPTLPMLVRFDLLGALTTTDHALADDILFFYAEGRFPCAWHAGKVTAVY